MYYWCVVSLSFDCLEKSSRFRLLLLCFLSSNRVIRCVYDNTNNELYWIIGGREEDPSSFSSFSSLSLFFFFFFFSMVFVVEKDV